MGGRPGRQRRGGGGEQGDEHVAVGTMFRYSVQVGHRSPEELSSTWDKPRIPLLSHIRRATRHWPRAILLGPSGDVHLLHVGTRFLRTGCTVLWQLSHNFVGSEFTIPRPFPFAIHGGTVAAPVAGNKYRQVAEKGELSVRSRYSCSTSTPVLDLIHAPRQGCPNASVQKSQKHLVERTGELARAC